MASKSTSFFLSLSLSRLSSRQVHRPSSFSLFSTLLVVDSNFPCWYSSSRYQHHCHNPRILTKSFSAMTSAAPQPSSTNQTIKKWPNITLYGDLGMRPFRNIWMLEEIGLPYNHKVCRPWSRVAKSVHPLGKVPAMMVEGNEEEDGSTIEKKNKFVVLESAAINTFLGDLARELPLTSNTEHDSLPRTLVPPPATPERAKYDSLAMFVMTELDSQSLWIHRKHHDLSDVFGEAPTAVEEAKRQFDNALDAMVDEITTAAKEDSGSNNNEEMYLLPTGFSAVDIIFANCCFWAQQIEWLEKKPGDNSTTITTSSTSEKQNNESDENNSSTIPKPLNPELAAYLKRIRSRPAFVRANELRKKQVYEKKKKEPISKL